MKWVLIIGVILVMSVGPAIGEDLTKLSLDDVSGLGTTIQSDSENAQEEVLRDRHFGDEIQFLVNDRYSRLDRFRRRPERMIAAV